MEKIGHMVNYCAGAADYAINKIAKYVRELCYLVQDNSDLYMEFPTVDVASKQWEWDACSRDKFCEGMGGEEAIEKHLSGSDVNLLKAVGNIMTGMLMDKYCVYVCVPLSLCPSLPSIHLHLFVTIHSFY